MVLVTAALVLLAALPSVWPQAFPMLQPVKVDTDPENMLSPAEAVRVFHNRMKEVLALHDMVVLGIVNETHPDGVFNPQSLRNLFELTQYAMTLRGDALGVKNPQAGVIEVDVIAPSTVDNIEQGGVGVVRFEWLMPSPPATEQEALAVRDKARRIPFLNGTLVSEDGKAVCLYLPLTAKSLSYKVYSKLREKVATLQGEDQYFITGLPVAEDTFGVEMFIQMAISAPLAMLVIFLLMLLFFRKLTLIISPMIVAVVTVLCTMGLLIVTGNTIHIMSSMIPIFIMPISILDSIHVLSEFSARYQALKDRRKTIESVMDTLFMPMLYTSLTSVAGFVSLALTPIPPVQVFGISVGVGIMLAWVFTVTFIPAYVMFIPERSLKNFGLVHTGEDESAHSRTWMGRFLMWCGHLTYQRAKLILALACVAAVVALYGITRIQINDNPTKWFKKSHPIRVADRVLNEHFGGTYTAFLALRPKGEALPEASPAVAEEAAPAPSAPVPGEESMPALPEGLGDAATEPALPEGLGGTAAEEAPAPVAASVEATREEVFKNPAVLRYIGDLQRHLLSTAVVGKSNSLADIVKTVHRELIDGTDKEFRIPDTPSAVAQCLMQYQSSHRPGDLWHFVTPDYRHTSIWVQLKSGDNLDMSKVVAAMDDYMTENPPPVALEHDWFGLTYINVVWQEKMVTGMFQSFLGSFLVVLLMMIVLFGSGLWGFLSMVPLTITIGLIYGVIGLVGKDYDMPVAVLSSLTLGLAVDFSIHFLSRSRTLYAEYGSWEKTHTPMFGEPARAIALNVIVVAVGFMPLLFAPLMPYVTVGFFMAAILAVSGVGTLLILPGLIRLFEPLLFPKTKLYLILCRCGTCIVTAVTAVAVVVLNVHQFFSVGCTQFTIVSLVLVPILAGSCALLSRRERCKAALKPKQEGGA
jgi:predicted RND superfamily exporter protein